MAYLMYTYHKFGDLCTAYGLVREFARYAEKIELHSDYRTDDAFNTQVRLYSGMKNVELIREPIEWRRGTFGHHSIAHSQKWLDKVLPWLENPDLLLPEWFSDYWRFDTQWYGNAGVPFNLKWDNFDFQRNEELEKEAYYDKFRLKDGEEFLFIHQDPERNYFIKQEHLKGDIKHIYFQDYPEVNILDILYTVERAKEVHTFNTGTATLIDQIGIKHDNLYYHRYLRHLEFEQPIRKLEWKMII